MPDTSNVGLDCPVLSLVVPLIDIEAVLDMSTAESTVTSILSLTGDFLLDSSVACTVIVFISPVALFDNSLAGIVISYSASPSTVQVVTSPLAIDDALVSMVFINVLTVAPVSAQPVILISSALVILSFSMFVVNTDLLVSVDGSSVAAAGFRGSVKSTFKSYIFIGPGHTTPPTLVSVYISQSPSVNPGKMPLSVSNVRFPLASATPRSPRE